ncbi:MAG: hypothetical protein ACKVP4_10585 [Hyphomicrobium sp.]
MAAFADFSSAVPWVGGGFVAGVVACVLARALTGADRRHDADVLAVRTELDAIQASASALTASRDRLEAELMQVAPRAALASQLESEVTQLRNVGRQHQASLSEAANQIASLRQELESGGGDAQYYQDEYARLAEKHDLFSKTTYAQLSEMTKTVSDLNEQIAAEAAAHREVIAGLTDEVATLQREGVDRQLYESEVAALLGTVKELRTEATAAERAVKESRALLEHSSGLKDAVQALNRIAAALPEQTARH